MEEMEDTDLELPARTLFTRSRRFDLVFKVQLARAWIECDAALERKALPAYLEAIRAHNSFYEEEPPKSSPKDYVDAYRKTVESISRKGFDPMAEPIRVGRNLELCTGAHRLAACLAANVPCRARVMDCEKTTGNGFESFRFGRLSPAVANWGVRAYVRLNPMARVIAGSGAVPHSAVPWYRTEKLSVVSFPDGIPESIGQSHDEAVELADASFRGEEFPDWRERADSLGGWYRRCRAEALLLGVRSFFSHGRKKAKLLKRIRALERNCRGAFLFADYMDAVERERG